MNNSEVVKKFLLLVGSLVLFACMTIPIYFFMVSHTKRFGPEAEIQTTPEVSSEIPMDGFFPGQQAETAGLEAQMQEQDILLKTEFELHKGVFFGGFILIIVLYIIYFVGVLRPQFYPFLVGNEVKMLFPGLVPFLLFMVMEAFEIFIIPTSITKRIASFRGMPWEITYILLGFFLIFTLVGIWMDTNLNRVSYPDGVPFHYCRFGFGAKNLILIAGLNLPGLAGQGLNMAWAYRMFAKDYTVYVMDKKDVVPEGVTLEDLAEDIYKVMDEIGLVSADVVGVSQGGMIAQYLTLNHPEIVDKLVLGVTSSKMNEKIQNYVNLVVTLAKKGEMEKIMLDSFENDFTPDYTKKLKPFLPMLSKVGIPKSNTRVIRLAQSIQTLDTYDRLEEIKCPVFVVGAGRDRIVTEAESLDIAEKLQCKKYVFKQYGHGVYSEAKEFNEKIYKFLMRG